MYKNHNSKQKALFLPITQDIVQRIQNDTLSICSPFWINRKQDEEVYVLMTSHFIVLCSKAGINYNYHYYTPLDFDLKFEVLGEDVSNPESEANSIVSKPTGFRLTRKDTATVDFHIIGANVLGVWLKYLTKTLNQIGFHKLFRPLRKLGKGGFATVY